MNCELVRLAMTDNHKHKDFKKWSRNTDNISRKQEASKYLRWDRPRFPLWLHSLYPVGLSARGGSLVLVDSGDAEFEPRKGELSKSPSYLLAKF